MAYETLLAAFKSHRFTQQRNSGNGASVLITWPE